MTKRNFILLLTYLICSVIILIEFGIDTAFKISIVMMIVTFIFLISCLCVYLGVLSLKEAKEEKNKLDPNKTYCTEISKDKITVTGYDKRPIIDQLNEVYGKK